MNTKLAIVAALLAVAVAAVAGTTAAYAQTIGAVTQGGAGTQTNFNAQAAGANTLAAAVNGGSGGSCTTGTCQGSLSISITTNQP